MSERAVLQPNCDLCESPSLHISWIGGKEIHHCCYHHIIDGGIPSDWHPNCMATTREAGVSACGVAPSVAPCQADERFARVVK